MAGARWLETLPLPLGRLDALDRLARVLVDHERSDRFHRGSRNLSLGPMRRLDVLLGRPLSGTPVVHVAGSKGKGSVCLLLDGLLAAHGLATGLYLSPHVDRWNERIRVGGRSLAPTRMTRAVEAVLRTAARHGAPAPTFFEVLTAAAFRVFREADVDVAVVEVGLGGRLDATNVVQPAVTVITSVEREHVAVLGRTLCEIAHEKAGIIKRRCPVVSGLEASSATAGVVRTRARERGAPLYEWGRELRLRRRQGRLRIELQGEPALEVDEPRGGPFAARNAALALGALRLLGRRHSGLGLGWESGRLSAALGGVHLAGRCERLGDHPPLYRDGAHTPRSLRAVTDWVARRHPGIRPLVVLGLQRDKDLGRCLRALQGRIGLLIATRVPGDRSRSPEELASAARALDIPVRTAAEPEGAVALARDLARADQGVLVAGSFWLAGAVAVGGGVR